MTIITPRSTRLRLAAIVLIAVGVAACSSDTSSPTMASTSASVSSVSFEGTTVAVGGTVAGTVHLSGVAPSSGAVIVLASSNTAAIAVPVAVTVPAGRDTATFTATAVNVGTAIVRATFNGTTALSASLTSRTIAMLSITPITSVVVGGEPLPAAVTLTGPAPAGGVVVALSAADPITVPPTVTIPAGRTGADFTILTREVGGTMSGTVTGSYGGGTATATVTVIRPTVLRAKFGVTGPTQSDTCALSDGGNTLNCTFDGSTSTGPDTITSWEWTYAVTTARSQTTTTPVLTKPSFDCSMIPPPPLSPGTGWLTMVVTLRVRDSLGNVSAEATEGDARLLPQGSCGY